MPEGLKAKRPRLDLKGDLLVSLVASMLCRCLVVSAPYLQLSSSSCVVASTPESLVTPRLGHERVALPWRATVATYRLLFRIWLAEVSMRALSE